MNRQEEIEYQEKMGGPEMEYLQYMSEHPELQEEQERGRKIKTEKLQDLRKQWLTAKQAGDTKTMESIERIGKAIKNNEVCRDCRERVAELDGYFCSTECKDSYYPPVKGRPTAESLKKKLLELKRDAHFKENKQGRLDL